MEHGGVLLEETQLSNIIDSIVGMSSVKRFHGRTTIHQQTIADHSCRVAQLAFFIALEQYKGDYTKANYVATQGLFHDFSESILKNDLSNPIKSRHGIGQALKKLETDVVKTMFPESEHIQNLILEKAEALDYNILKLADIIDFGLYVWDEIQCGNKHMLPLISVFQSEFKKFPYPLAALDFSQACYNKIVG